MHQWFCIFEDVVAILGHTYIVFGTDRTLTLSAYQYCNQIFDYILAHSYGQEYNEVHKYRCRVSSIIPKIEQDIYDRAT